MNALLLAIALVQLTGPDGQRIDINESEVTSIREPSSVNQGHFGPGTRCVIVMSNGKFIAVSENCMTVRDKLKTDVRIEVPGRPCTVVCAGKD
jgi:hypothetical protein